MLFLTPSLPPLHALIYLHFLAFLFRCFWIILVYWYFPDNQYFCLLMKTIVVLLLKSLALTMLQWSRLPNTSLHQILNEFVKVVLETTSSFQVSSPVVKCELLAAQSWQLILSFNGLRGQTLVNEPGRLFARYILSRNASQLMSRSLNAPPKLLMIHPPRKLCMILHSFFPSDSTIHFSKMGRDFNIMPECFGEQTVSLQAWVNWRLLLSHLHSLKTLETCTRYTIEINSFLSLSCFVKHLPLRPLMHEKVITLMQFI